MDLSEIWIVAERARERGKFSRTDTTLVREKIPATFRDLDSLKLPKSVKHPGGFTVTDASVRTFLRAALLLSGKKALGKRFGGDPFYERVEYDLAFGIMRSNFQLGYPKGTHCCGSCTLAVYPVLAAGAIRYFDTAALARDVHRIITKRQWRFAGRANDRMIAWALGTST